MEETIARLVQGFIAFGLAYTVALWTALVLWTWRDISSRATNPVVQIFSTLVVVLFFAPGAVIYMMLRPRETLDEAYQRTVAEEYLIQDLEEFPACPACRRPIRDDFAFCPHCRSELRRPCPDCSKLVDLGWEACAYCGKPGHGRLSVPSAFDRTQWDGASSEHAPVDPRTELQVVGVQSGSSELVVPPARVASTGSSSNGSHSEARPSLDEARTDPARGQDWERHPDESDS